MSVTILLLAAGASSRMRGADKLLQQVDGVALLRRQALAALGTGAPLIVALPARPALSGPRRAALAGLALAVTEVPGEAPGMGDSLRHGVRAAGHPGGLMVMLADMPEIETGDLTALIAAFAASGADRILRAGAQDGTPGHPVIFPADCLSDLGSLTGDSGARNLLRDRGAQVLPLAGRRALVDLDTPEDWAAWQKARGRGEGQPTPK